MKNSCKSTLNAGYLIEVSLPVLIEGAQFRFQSKSYAMVLVYNNNQAICLIFVEGNVF